MAEEPPDDRPETGDAPNKAARRKSAVDDSPRETTEEKPASGRLYRLGKRILDRGDDVKDLASAFIETSDRAKTEMVKMIAREVRTYLDELKLKEELLKLATSHSVELKMSLHLKPLAPAATEKPATELEKRKTDGE